MPKSRIQLNRDTAAIPLFPIKEEASMPGRRTSSENLESLRATLQKLEQTDAPAEDPESFADLKRILLSRIADLELAQMLETAEAATDKAPNAADLVPPPLAEEENHPEGPGKDTDLENLD